MGGVHATAEQAPRDPPNRENSRSAEISRRFDPPGHQARGPNRRTTIAAALTNRFERL